MAVTSPIINTTIDLKGVKRVDTLLPTITARCWTFTVIGLLLFIYLKLQNENDENVKRKIL